MRKRGVYLLLLGSLLAVGLVALFLVREREPAYGGKNLSYWVTNLARANPYYLDDPNPYYPDDPRRVDSEEALRHIGPRAVPHLLRWLRWEPSPWRKKLPAVVTDILRKVAPNSFASDETNRRRSSGSAKAIARVGPLPPEAIAQLSAQMQIPRHGGSADRAGIALASLGPRGIPSLMAAVTNQSDIVRSRALLHLWDAGTNALPAAPLLIDCLKERSNVALFAAKMLAKLRPRSDLVVRGLAECVLDVNAHIVVRRIAADTLESYGQEALPAAGILRKALDDPDFSIRITITNVLKECDPQSLKGADR